MIHSTIHLKEYFPFLGENNRDPFLTVYALENLVEMGRQDMLRPTILICPGGGYVNVSKRESEPIAMQFLSKGYNAVVLHYSCKPNTFPVQLQEVAATMELIHKNTHWHCDPNRVAILGFSAGGHLAAHYTNCYDCPEVRQVFPQSKGVQATILGYPVITAQAGHRHLGSFLNLSGHQELTAEDIQKFSLENKVTAKTPPTFLWHTAADSGVPVMNSLLYAQALAAHGVPFALHVYPYGHHGLSTVDEQTNNGLDAKVTPAADWIETVLQWLKITL